MKATILLVEDDRRYASRIAKNLSLDGYDVLTAYSGEEALDLFDKEAVDLVLSDIKMPGMNGIDLLKKITERTRLDELEIPVIFLTSVDSVRVAVDAMKAGASDYITKDADRDEIVLRIEKVLSESKVRAENRSLKRHIQTANEFGRLIAVSPPIRAILQEIEGFVDAFPGILIEGETGVGKEIIARYIHTAAPAPAMPSSM